MALLKIVQNPPLEPGQDNRILWQKYCGNGEMQLFSTENKRGQLLGA
jgi:hypothetical protein